MWQETVAPAEFSEQEEKFLTSAMNVNYGLINEFGTPR
jgi:hypothetical protein